MTNFKTITILCLLALCIYNYSNASETVQWQELINCTEETNGSIRSTSDASYASSGYSIQKITASEDGYFQFTQKDVYGMVGLSASPSGSGYSHIDYAIQLWGGNEVYVLELGTQKGLKTTWASGDVFTIKKIDEEVTFYKNDELFYTSETPSTTDLYADFAFALIDHGFDDPIMGPYCANEEEVVTWEAQNAVSIASDGSVTATSDASYSAHAYSQQSIAFEEDGYYSFTAGSLTGLIGLSTTPQGGGYDHIDFAIQLWTEKNVYIVELGTQRGNKTTWAQGDVFTVKKTGTTIDYLKNGEVFYSSEVAVSDDLYADFAFGGVGNTFYTPVIGKECTTDFWQEEIEVTSDAYGSITSTSDASYASSAYSIEAIDGNKDGYFEFKQRDFYGLVGLSASPQGGGYSHIDYAIQLWGSNEVYVVELGTQRGLKTTWATGDVFTVKKDNGIITYLKNDVVFYTSEVTVPSSTDLYADFATGLIGHGFDTPKIVETDIVTNVAETIETETSIYPNPTTGTIYFNEAISGTMSVSTVSGSQVFFGELSESTELNLDLNSGAYILLVETAEGTSTEILIVE